MLGSDRQPDWNILKLLSDRSDTKKTIDKNDYLETGLLLFKMERFEKTCFICSLFLHSVPNFSSRY